MSDDLQHRFKFLLPKVGSREFDLRVVSNFFHLVLRLCIEESRSLESYQISIISPQREVVKFLVDLTSSVSRLNSTGNGVILSQYEIDFFEILPTTDDQFYTVILENLSTAHCIFVTVY